ncbi:YitT family protein [Acidaminobacter sp. JC074]|uniref:YitT family protein n=1 Tax=Acidaminobacter sp. JC074 TaxID=2530199 RepID=UPI001F0F1B37|nr:YitT family protein [Acidaminobacter sp. JC074]MCH4891348.1 YitT family protein [Acidaminobacter sp. JC074]
MKNFKAFIVMNIGLFIMAVGLSVFLIPADLAVGGVTGLAMVIQHYVPSLNIGILMLVFNVILFTLGFLIIGSSFGGKTIYCSFALSGMIGLMEWLLPLQGPVVNDIVLNLVFGIVIQGIGMAIVFYQNASTGGTDIIAKIFNKFTGLDIGKALFLSDSLITLMAAVCFGLTLGLYAFIGILINGLIIDKVIANLDAKIHAVIVTNDTEVISDYIHETLSRGTTYLHGTGGYSKEDKQIISVVLNRKEFAELKHFIKRQALDAFITMNVVDEVYGEGFNLALQS